jgi:hypothetical protein
VSVHAAPKALISELGAVFGADQDLANVHAVLTAQHASDDLVNIGPDIEKEKDRCLEIFMAWGHAMQQHLHGAHGSWTDFFDPCSGLPVRGHNPRRFHAGHRWPPTGDVWSAAETLVATCLCLCVCVCLWHLSLPSVAVSPPFCVAFHHLSSPPSTPSQVFGASSTIYSEADGFALLRGYKTADAGGCKVVLHPTWSTEFYPATLVTNASPEQIEEALVAVAASGNGGVDAKA